MKSAPYFIACIGLPSAAICYHADNCLSITDCNSRTHYLLIKYGLLCVARSIYTDETGGSYFLNVFAWVLSFVIVF